MDNRQAVNRGITKRINRSSNDHRALGLGISRQIYVNTTNAVILVVIPLGSFETSMTDFDYTNASFDDLDQRAMDLLVFDDAKDLSVVLKGHLFIERILDSLIEQAVPNPDGLPSLNFDRKVDLANALDVIDAGLASSIKSLNRIRNRYAHRDGYKVTIPELEHLKYEWEPEQQLAYDAACAKGVDDAVLIATLFLLWACQRLLATPT